jgi:signal transduction histidine kinase
VRIHRFELRAGTADRQQVVLTVPVAPVRVRADPDRLRQALDAMFREVSATWDSVSVDCRTERGSVAIPIGSASMTVPVNAATEIRFDDSSAHAKQWAAASGSSPTCR